MKIKIGENEYTPSITMTNSPMGIDYWDSRSAWVKPSDILSALNELAQLRQERDSLQKRVEELEELFRLEHSGQTISNDGFRRINELVKLIKESPDEG